MAESDLRALRLRKNLAVRDMVDVVRGVFPKYDKTMQSKCENGDAYGVSIRPEAMNALYQAFDPDAASSGRKKKEGHRLTCRISARLEDDVYAELQRRQEAEGYGSMQELLTALVIQYLSLEKSGGDSNESRKDTATGNHGAGPAEPEQA